MALTTYCVDTHRGTAMTLLNTATRVEVQFFSMLGSLSASIFVLGQSMFVPKQRPTTAYDPSTLPLSLIQDERKQNRRRQLVCVRATKFSVILWAVRGYSITNNNNAQRTPHDDGWSLPQFIAASQQTPDPSSIICPTPPLPPQTVTTSSSTDGVVVVTLDPMYFISVAVILSPTRSILDCCYCLTSEVARLRVE